jgi:AraC family transcriptional regulator
MALILKSLPDLSDAAARRQFADRASGESAIVFGTARDAYTAAGSGPLMLRAVLDGREEVLAGRHRVVLDEDVYLVLNSGTTHATRIRAEQPVFSFAVYFADALVAQVLGWRRSGGDRLLEPGTSVAGSAMHFSENLRPHDHCVSPVLRYLMHISREQACDSLWYDEQLHFLLERIIAGCELEEARVTSLRAVRARTRREIHRRIARATDYILSNYDSPLDLKSMAEVACLEKHHFLKLFAMVHGLTPFEFLRRKRLVVALRLLRHSDSPQGEIARLSGLGTRHTLLRALKEFTGVSPQGYKRLADQDACGWHGEFAHLLESGRGRLPDARRAPWREVARASHFDLAPVH